jgi:sugar phosphate isomerase/epimerase
MAALSGSACIAPAWMRAAAEPPSPPPNFKLGAISDGFSQDFEQALKVMKSYSLRWVEIRKVFGIYNTETTPVQVRQMKELIDRYGFRVSVIDSAVFKCTLPGTVPVVHDEDTFPYQGQMDHLRRACDRAHALGAEKIRIFTFWRVAEPATLSHRIAAELEKAVGVANQCGMRLVIENEEACNAATGHELSAILAMVPASNLGANWDVGNGYMQGEISYPDGYRVLDKKRIWHMHLKSMTCQPGLKACSEAIAGQGQVDLVGQFKALLRDRYNGTMSVECEFEAPGLTHLETTKRSVEGVLRAMAAAVGERS